MEWNRWQTSREPPAMYRPFNQGPHVCSRASEGLCVIRLQMTQLLFHLWDTTADSPRIFT